VKALERSVRGCAIVTVNVPVLEADIRQTFDDVGYWHKADIAIDGRNVCF
jgi:hypothetical protein